MLFNILNVLISMLTPLVRWLVRAALHYSSRGSDEGNSVTEVMNNKTI